MEKDELLSNFKAITDQLAQLNTSVGDINNRVNSLEQNSGGPASGGSITATHNASSHHVQQSGQLPSVQQQQTGGDSGDSVISADVIQHSFKQLAEKYQKTYLPPEHKLFIERTGFRGEESRKLTVVQNCTKYSETILKILASSPQDSLPKEQVQEVVLCAMAQQSYLQGVYANLVVHSSFDSQTAKLFTQLQRNTAAFPSSLLPQLQSAAAISAAAQSAGSRRDNNRGSNYRGRGYYRGSRNYGNRGRGSYPYNVSGGFPQDRPDGEHQDP